MFAEFLLSRLCVLTEVFFFRIEMQASDPTAPLATCCFPCDKCRKNSRNKTTKCTLHVLTLYKPLIVSALQNLGCDQLSFNLLCLIALLHTNMTTNVCPNGASTGPFPTLRSSKRVCVLVHVPFSIFFAVLLHYLENSTYPKAGTHLHLRKSGWQDLAKNDIQLFKTPGNL